METFLYNVVMKHIFGTLYCKSFNNNIIDFAFVFNPLLPSVAFGQRMFRSLLCLNYKRYRNKVNTILMKKYRPFVWDLKVLCQNFPNWLINYLNIASFKNVKTLLDPIKTSVGMVFQYIQLGEQKGARVYLPQAKSRSL